MQDLRKFQDWFYPRLETLLHTYLEAFTELYSDEELQRFASHMRKLLSGGKRIRPYLCALGYRAAGGKDLSLIERPLVGLELFHTFALIHDDIIDRSDLRRGVVSLHSYIEKTMLNDPSRASRTPHVAEGQALLLGDALFSWSMQMLYTSANADVTSEVAKMIDEVVVGQMIDVQSTMRSQVTERLIEEKMQYKTSSYTFTRPFRIGLALAGVEDSVRDRYRPFTDSLGRAFQIQDDYLDLMGDSERTGKPILSDIQEGQHSIFTQLIQNSAPSDLAARLSDALGKTMTKEEAVALRDALSDSPLLQEGVDEFKQEYAHARALLQDCEFPDDITAAFTALIDYLTEREM